MCALSVKIIFDTIFDFDRAKKPLKKKKKSMGVQTYVCVLYVHRPFLSTLFAFLSV